MKGTAITLIVRHATGRKTALQTKVQAKQYGPVAVFNADGLICLAHVASGVVLLTLPNLYDAARAIEHLTRLVSDWGYGFDGRHAVFSPSLRQALYSFAV